MSGMQKGTAAACRNQRRARQCLRVVRVRLGGVAAVVVHVASQYEADLRAPLGTQAAQPGNARGLGPRRMGRPERAGDAQDHAVLVAQLRDHRFKIQPLGRINAAVELKIDAQ